MTRVSRRQFLGGALGAAAAVSLGSLPLRLLAASGKKAGDFQITDIERYEITPPYHDYNGETLRRYHGRQIQSRTVLIAKTNVGIEGFGEAWGLGGPDEATMNKYIGTSPFDWIGDTANLAINMIVYDLMGKFLGLPAWKLIGSKKRDWIPVAAWTVDQHPKALATEVQSVAARGYHWLKYHIGQINNVVDQTAAMQLVAPKGFKVHYDFNGDSNVEAVFPVLRELEKFPIVGRIEDPIQTTDFAGYRLLREKCKIPILLHHAPKEVLAKGVCDGYMAGHAPVGVAAKANALAEATNTPIMLQNAGGTINQAFLAHEVAVFSKATIDHVNLCHLWTEDITVESMPVVGGSVRVPSGPGLGVTVDRARLERFASAPQRRPRPFLVRIRYSGGPTIFARHDPDRAGHTDDLRFLHRLLGLNVPGPVPGYGNPVVSDFIDERDSEFAELWEKTASGAHVVEGR